MKYRDLIHIDPIESVVQLRSSVEQEPARRLTHSYVVSDTMAERLVTLALPQLQFDQPADQKGLLVVGNYGTGKSHLMAVVAALAEDAALLSELRHDGLRSAFAAVAGRFKVIRVEIGGTVKALRDILLDELSDGLAALGAPYEFPRAFEVTGHKTAFEAMMARFAEAYPDHGLLLVVDELLDYLRTRSEQQLVLDLSFLREIGEICRDLRFRFIAGVQEALFDSPRFEFVADSMRRVKARFEQVHIARTDIQFVVARRLLQKTAAQEQAIRAHLQPFTKFYGTMADRMDEFVRLFPVHPDYFEVFERLVVAEKREVLKTLSRAMTALLDQDVPADAPGLLAFDSYWATLAGDPVFRADPQIRAVVDVAEQLATRVDAAMTKRAYKPAARRLIDALAIHRLTVGDVYRPIGATPEELRDRLCLYDRMVAEMGGEPDKDLLGHVRAVLAEIHKVVSGQFVTYSEASDQWRLDLQKTVDFDARIEQRAESLDPELFDRYFFAALRVGLEVTDEPQHTGYNIWQRDILWPQRNAPRSGYLFFGTPNERSTAAPPRDFYLYFLQPNKPPAFRKEHKADEVFFRLTERDDECEGALRRYAAAAELANMSSGSEKRSYDAKAAEHRIRLVQWLAKHADDAVLVGYRGKEHALGVVCRDAAKAGALRSDETSLRDRVFAAAAHRMAGHFAETAPHYPKFSVLITAANRAQAAQDALHYLAGAKLTKQAAAVLDALKLLDGDLVRTAASPYAQQVLDRLRAQPAGQVLNRDALITSLYGLEYMALDGARLEPEWAVVVLAALVYTGEAVLAIPGKTFDAASMPALAAAGVDELSRFKHLQLPKEWNLPALTAAFELLGLPPGLPKLLTTGSDEPLKALANAAAAAAARIAQLRAELQRGVDFWSLDLGPNAEQAELLKNHQAFLESLLAYKNLGQIKNFRSTVDDVRAETQARALAEACARRLAFKRRFDADVAWLNQAEGVLPPAHAWIGQLHEVRNPVLAALAQPTADFDAIERDLAARLTALRTEFTAEYRRLHARARLDAAADKRKAALAKDARMQALQRLATLPTFTRSEFTSLGDAIGDLRSCADVDASALARQPLCPHCQFRPVNEPRADAAPADERLRHAEAQATALFDRWVQRALDDLDDPSLHETLALLTDDARAAITAFRAAPTDPLRIDGTLVNALNEAFAGLERVVVTPADLAAALAADGGVATPDELRQRFDAFVQSLTRGHDLRRVRFVVQSAH
jgi:hypothetical protein